jgi:hypothetical protein
VLVQTGRKKRVKTLGNMREFVCANKVVYAMKISRQGIWSKITIWRE